MPTISNPCLLYLASANVIHREDIGGIYGAEFVQLFVAFPRDWWCSNLERWR